VRNPVSCAILANNFIKITLQELKEDEPIAKESLRMLREDTDAIDTSLSYTNELLFSMLDLHRAASYQIKIETAAVDLKVDVLEPVAAMLQLCGREDSCTTSAKIQLDCPNDLIVLSDRLRLTQMVLNLGRNSTLFCSQGFVRLRGYVVNGTVHIAVEDSGPGIHEDMHDTLFCKFRDRLDSLNQGGGLGLSLCKKVTEIMGSHIWFDKGYDSGVDGCPGARFIINLNKPPHSPDQTWESWSSLHEENSMSHKGDASDEDGTTTVEEQLSIEEVLAKLPDVLSVLFVDDDALLRKMFKRSLEKVRPRWQIREAASGESALVLVQEQRDEYAIIFMDQYMPGIHKTLLGTETVQTLRANGCRSIICGLSANENECLFKQAGADAFLLKPLVCGEDALARQLLRLLSCREVVTSN
jgi:CheY-like chemotaxis protein